jgi:hypothetical protein
MRRRWLVPLVLFTASTALASACRKRLSAEAEVREAIETAAQGVRDRKLKKIAALVSQEYRDRDGNDRKAILDVVRAHILLRPNVFLISHVSSVTCEPATCTAAVVAAMASVPSQDLSDLLKSQADVYRFDLTFVGEDGTWRVRSAQWRPAGAQDLL